MEKVIAEKQLEGVLLDQDHPWPGLVSFSEANQFFFFGREREVKELERLVRQETLTVFFGKSGLGKSSILRAGLAPLLRESEFIPVYIRLNHAEAAPLLEDQVEIAIEEVFEQEQIDGPRPIRSESLWEYFHKKKSDWWDSANRRVKPVLVFDQFEELMTVGQENPTRSSRTERFLCELEDLVENRPPASLVERFKQERDLADEFDHRRSDFRVILTLREDFLPDLEGLRERLRPIMFNRLRLLPMSGEQALDVILKPGGHLVDEDVAIRIVDFVSLSERSRLQAEVRRAQIAKRAIEPALLGVVLQELNSRRLQVGQDKITAELVGKTNPTEIFHNFYVRGLQGMDGAVRDFIEESLLTSSGARNRIAEEDALTKRGVSCDVISKLIDCRILQRETTGNTKWLELTHDALGDVVRTDRAEHHQQRQLELARARADEAQVKLRRVQKLAAVFAGLLVIAGALLWLLAARVESQANGTVAALKTELDAPAPGAPDRVTKAINRLSTDASHFFFLHKLKLAHGQALAYGAQVLYFNGWIKEGCDYSEQAVRMLDNFGSDPAAAISRASAHYARAQGQLHKGQLSKAEQDFRSAVKLAETASKRAMDPEERNRIHVLAELGLGEVKSAQDSRGEAEKIFKQVQTEVKAVFPNSAQKDGSNATIYEVSALKGLGVIRELSGRVNDTGSEAASDAGDFLEEADMKISKAVSEYPDNVALRNAQAETAYLRIFFLSESSFLSGSGRKNANYASVATRLRDALSKGKSLSNLDKQNLSWKLLLAQDYRLQGKVLQTVHEDIDALEAFEKMRELAAEVQQSESSWLNSNYILAIAEYYMVDSLSALSTYDLQTFQDRLAKISARDNSDFGKATTSLSKAIAEINKNGDQSSQKKRWSEAIADYRVKMYREVRQELEKLLHDAPGNAQFEWTKALIISHIGDVEVSRGRLPAGLTAYREALDAINRLPVEVTRLPDFQGLAATINESLGGALRQAAGEDNARLALEKALRIRDNLAKSQASVDKVASWCGTYILIGDDYLKQGNREKAQELYQTAIQVYEKYEHALASAATDPTNGPATSRRTQLLREKAQGFSYIAWKWRTAGAAVRDFGAAAANLRQAIESAKKVFRLDPFNAEVISFLNGIKRDWEKFCKDQLKDAKLSERDKVNLRSIAGLLKEIPPNLLPGAGATGESLNWQILPLIPGTWRNLRPEEQAAEIRYLAQSEIQPPLKSADISRIRTLGLSFYEDANLYEVEVKKQGSAPVFLNYIRTGTDRGRLRDFSSVNREEARNIFVNRKEPIDGVRLDGTMISFDLFNSRNHPILQNEVSATGYLRLIIAGIQSSQGTFHIIDNEGDLHWTTHATSQDRQNIQRRIYPLTVRSTVDGWEAKGTIAYSNAVFYAVLQLSPDGHVSMAQDELVKQKLPVAGELFVKGFRVVTAPNKEALGERAQSAVKAKN
jgi:tetratricopeptide (TPR) repeat protein